MMTDLHNVAVLPVLRLQPRLLRGLRGPEQEHGPGAGLAPRPRPHQLPLVRVARRREDEHHHGLGAGGGRGEAEHHPAGVEDAEAAVTSHAGQGPRHLQQQMYYLVSPSSNIGLTFQLICNVLRTGEVHQEYDGVDGESEV